MADRIELTDSFPGAIHKLSEGNPGAITALMEACTKSPDIDPESAFGVFAPLISLDTYGIYGSEIYILWNDKCQRDVRKFLILIRAVQLGFLNNLRLKELAEDARNEKTISEEEWKDIEAKVLDFLPEFSRG